MPSVRIRTGAPKTSTALVILPLPGVIGVLHRRQLQDTNSPRCPQPPPSLGRNPITLRVPRGQQDRPGTHPAPQTPTSRARHPQGPWQPQNRTPRGWDVPSGATRPVETHQWRMAHPKSNCPIPAAGARWEPASRRKITRDGQTDGRGQADALRWG